MEMTVVLQTLEDTHNFAKDIVGKGYRYFLLEGELGVGKTQFVKGVVAALGGESDQVQSPTYTYMNEYHTPHGTLVHMDLYRLESQQQALEKGIFDAIDQHDLVCIEWPAREDHYTDATWVRLSFVFTADGNRQVTLTSLD